MTVKIYHAKLKKWCLVKFLELYGESIGYGVFHCSRVKSGVPKGFFKKEYMG